MPSRPRPETVTGPESRSSVRMVSLAEDSSRAKIWSRKDIQFKKATTTESTEDTGEHTEPALLFRTHAHLPGIVPRLANGVVYQAIQGLSATRIRVDQAVCVTAARRSIIACPIMFGRKLRRHAATAPARTPNAMIAIAFDHPSYVCP